MEHLNSLQSFSFMRELAEFRLVYGIIKQDLAWFSMDERDLTCYGVIWLGSLGVAMRCYASLLVASSGFPFLVWL